MAGADRFEDLITWQRMYELSLEVWKFTRHAPASKDFGYRDQIRDASDSAHRNVAEGFGRYTPPQFANLLDVSRASTQETRALLKKGLDMGYLTDEQFRHLDRLAVRGLQALARFQRYLRSPVAKRNAERSRYHRKRSGHRERNENSVVSDPDGQNDPNDPNGQNDPNDPNDPNVPNE